MKNLLLAVISLVMLTGTFNLATAAGSDDGDLVGYLALEPAFIMNIPDGNKLYFLQVNAQLKINPPEAVDKVALHTPVIRHRIILLLNTQRVLDLYSTVGKERLRKQALAEIREVLKDKIGNIEIENILFSNFIIK